MLDDLRRIIESEMEYDDLNDIMMEATDNSIAAMFIEEDGEAVISDSEVMSILEKIPDYDEEAAMNKKLARIAEAYIPEELEYEEVEEGFINRLNMRKWTIDQLNEELDNIEEEIRELEEKEDKSKQDEKRLKKAKKELADVKHLINVKSERVQESCEEDDEYDDCEEDLDDCEDDEDAFLFEAFGLEKLRKKKVDIEVIWGGGKEISCAIIEPENHETDIDSIRIPTPEKFIDPDAGGSDEELLAYVKKSIKKQLRKKGYKINKIFMH